MSEFNKKRRLIEWHVLKTWPEEFAWTISGIKNFEWRKNDRDFQSGDFLILEEWNPKTKEYTGRSCTRMIDYILTGKFDIPEGYVIMATKPV